MRFYSLIESSENLLLATAPSKQFCPNSFSLDHVEGGRLRIGRWRIAQWRFAWLRIALMFAKYQLISIIFNKFLFILPGMAPTGFLRKAVRSSYEWSQVMSSVAINSVAVRAPTTTPLRTPPNWLQWKNSWKPPFSLFNFHFSLPLNRPKQSLFGPTAVYTQLAVSLTALGQRLFNNIECRTLA